jgi:hypothetical protein
VGRDNLFLIQSGCTDFDSEHHFVMLIHSPDMNPATPDQNFFVRYWDDASFIDLAGPCASNDLDSCLAGN